MSHTADGRPGAETETWVRPALDALAALPGVHRIGVALAEGGGRRLLFTASDRDGGEVTDWCEVDAYEDVPLNHTVRTGQLVCGSLDDLAVRYPDFVARQGGQTRAFASVPLAAAGQVLGAFALYYQEPQPFDDAQRDALERLGRDLGERLRGGRRTRSRAGRSLGDEPVPEGALAATHVVPPDPLQVAPARAFVRSTLTAWGVDGEGMDAAVLCVSELVTNALIHSAAGCEVRIVLQDGVLTATVRDEGAGAGQPRQPTEDLLAVHGRGLGLVAALSARWGSEVDAVGMTVWCELDVS